MRGGSRTLPGGVISAAMDGARDPDGGRVWFVYARSGMGAEESRGMASSERAESVPREMRGDEFCLLLVVWVP